MAQQTERPSFGEILKKILEQPERGNHFTYHRTALDEPHVVQIAHDDDLDLIPLSVSKTRLCIVLAKKENRVLVYDSASNAFVKFGSHAAYYNSEARKFNEMDLVHSLTLEEFLHRYSPEAGITIIPDTANEGPHQHTGRISEFLVERWLEKGEITEQNEHEDEALTVALSGAIHNRLCNVLDLRPDTDGEYEKHFKEAERKLRADTTFLEAIGELQAARDEQFRPRVEEWCKKNLEFWTTEE